MAKKADYSNYIRIEKKIFEETTKPISPDREVREYYEGWSPMNTEDKVLLYVNLETSIDINKIMGYEKYPAISYYIVGINDGRLFQIDNTTFVKPKSSRFGERTIKSFENGGS